MLYKLMKEGKSMGENVKLEASGLKCDNITCDYRDETIQLCDFESYVNAPCPKCGESLLTQEDYEILKIIMSVSEFINGLDLPEPDEDEAKAKISFNTDGSGNLGVNLERL